MKTDPRWTISPKRSAARLLSSAIMPCAKSITWIPVFARRPKNPVRFPFPPGPEDLCAALAKGLIPVTRGAVDIISSCTLCESCDRQCHFVTGMRPVKVMQELIASFAEIAEKHGIEHDLGIITPLDLGKRGILEYDYYIDQTDSADAKKIRLAMIEIEPMVDNVSRSVKGVTFLKYIFSQGCARKENFLYT